MEKEKEKCSCCEEDSLESNEEITEEDDGIVELTGDDGKVLKFYHLGTIEYKKNYYAAFSPAEKIDGLNDDELVIYQLSGDNEEDSELIPIEDQDLLDEVYEEFCKVMEETDDGCGCDDEDCDDDCDCGCNDKSHNGCGCDDEEDEDCCCGDNCNCHSHSKE